MALNFNARIDDDLTRIEFRDEASSIDIVNSKDTKEIGADYNSWSDFKQKGTVHFANELMKHL